MTKNIWGNTPPDIIAKLEARGYDDPNDLPSTIELNKILGVSYAKALKEELEEVSSRR